MSTISGLHLEQLQEVVEQQRAEIERLKATMSILADNFTHGWAGETRSDTIKNVEAIAHRALEPKP